jgi:hypothetical protein
MTLKQLAQVTVTHSQSIGKICHRAFIQRTLFYQVEGPFYRCLDTVPRRTVWCGFRPAAQTGAKPGFECRRRRRIKLTVARLWCHRRAYRTTKDAGAADPGKKYTVVVSIAILDCVIAGFKVQFHGEQYTSMTRYFWHISELEVAL